MTGPPLTPSFIGFSATHSSTTSCIPLGPRAGRLRGFAARALQGVWTTAAYGVSLPERLVRSLAAGVGGAVKETADFALPGMVKRTTLYSIFLERALRFIVEDVGQVEGAYEADNEEEGFFLRKIVGNFVEVAGLMTLHASPLWILAIAGDAAFGARTYLDLLVEELKSKGVLEDADTEDTIESVAALLARLEKLSAAGALAIDLPPTEIAALKEMALEARAELAGAAQDAAAFAKEADELLDPMREIAEREGVSLFDVSALMGMRAARTVSGAAVKSAPFAWAAAGAGYRMVNEEVFSYYSITLDEVRGNGFYASLRESYAPYAGTVMSHFKPGRSTLTDQLLSGALFRQMIASIRRT